MFGSFMENCYLSLVKKNKVLTNKKLRIMTKPTIPSSENAEIFSFKFDKHKFPRVWEAKKRELIRNGLSEEEAEKELFEMRIDMELIYEEDNGLFAVESEAIECVDIYSPYTNTKCDVED